MYHGGSDRCFEVTSKDSLDHPDCCDLNGSLLCDVVGCRSMLSTVEAQ